MSAIGPVNNLVLIQPHEGLHLRTDVAKVEPSAIPFADLLSGAVAHANAQGMAAEQSARAFADGVRDDIHGTMIAAKEAEIELKLVANVRNKLVEAFNDLWRMSV